MTLTLVTEYYDCVKRNYPFFVCFSTSTQSYVTATYVHLKENEHM